MIINLIILLAVAAIVGIMLGELHSQIKEKKDELRNSPNNAKREGDRKDRK